VIRAQIKKDFQGKNQLIFSKEISIMWHNELKEVRDLFEFFAKKAEELHELAYKDYRYIPGPSKKSIRKEKKNKKNDICVRIKCHQNHHLPLISRYHILRCHA